MQTRVPDMDQSGWESLYGRILDDFGFSRIEDEASARLLKALMQNADLIDDDDITVTDDVVVVGPASPDFNGLSGRTVIAAGSATECVMDAGIVPDIVVTDLDGDIQCQIDASRRGAVTFIHAHGDNSDLISEYAKSFTGPVVLTTQSHPDNVIRNYFGFTDGDRAVCIAFALGASSVELRGFDFKVPVQKDGTDMEVKMKKLRWAERIISSFGDRVRL